MRQNRRATMLKTSLLTAALLAVGQAAFAQPPVGLGGQIQQIPPAPAPRNSIPDIRIERQPTPVGPAPGGPKLLVRSVHVTGETLFSEADLIAATDFHPGAELDLSQLREMAAKISGYYNRRGYFVAQAYLPAQDIQDGVVTITVIEGRYDKVRLRNASNLSDRVANDVLGGLNHGDVVATAPLERRLLLLSDVPGVQVRSTLAPGGAVGTTDLLVDLTQGRSVSGSLEADNAGNRYTGAGRVGATVNLNDPLGLGDVASVRVLTSGPGLVYVRGSYQLQLRDATVGVAYARLQYRLGREFSSLHASGTEGIASLYGSYPLIRSRNDNLYASVDADDRVFEDDIALTAMRTNKRAEVLTFGLNGNHHDGLGGGGWSSFSLSGSVGDLNLRTPAMRATDAASARTQGQYGKLTFAADRLQTLSGPLSLYGQIRGQLASKNLDISEKMELGGAYGVRAYPEGEAYGDEGYVATLEARLLLPAAELPGRVQLFGFVDAGAVRIAKTPWLAGPNILKRSGAGAGATWAANNNFLVRASYAWRLGDVPATSGPDSAGRLWVEIVKFF